MAQPLDRYDSLRACRLICTVSVPLCIVMGFAWESPFAQGADPPPHRDSAARLTPIPEIPAVAPARRFPTSDLVSPRESGDEKLELDSQSSPIDLTTALALAGAENPQILIAMQRTVAASARQQLAAAQALPNINLGTNFDLHRGVLQQASGKILEVNRDAMYIGAGAQAVAAGSVSIPGIQYNLNVGESLYRYYAQQQRRDATAHHIQAVQNQIQLKVALAYLNLVGAQAHRAIAFQAKKESHEVALITAAYAKTGQGLPADAERAATEYQSREADLVRAEADIAVASARLAELLNLNQSQRLRATDNYLVPHPAVPELIPRHELIAMALIQRPELHEHQSLVHAALMELQSAKLLPFSPQIMFGYSNGMFGGGSNLVAGPTSVSGAAPDQARFSTLYGRSDLDAVAYWSLRNLGVGNKAIIGIAQAHFQEADLQLIDTMNRIRQEVLDAQIRTHMIYSRINLNERGIRASLEAHRQDLIRIRSNEGHPIETLDSLRLLRQSRRDYVESILHYNQAHIELYTALGNPPADMLARPIASPPPSPATAESDELAGLEPVAPDSTDHLKLVRRVRVIPIDLATSLSLAGFQNPEVLIAQTRVSEALALRQLAAAQFLPTINLGTSLDSHTGVLQQSSGNILSVRRQALFFGAGANAIAAGTVNIPGVVWNFNASEAVYNTLIARQMVNQRQYESEAERNRVLKEVVHAYLDLLEANGSRSIRLDVRNSSAEVARVTAAFAKTGQGRPADAERAATELYNRDAELLEAESDADRTSALLARKVGLDQSARYHPLDTFVVPHSIVPSEISLPELLAVALLQRPELKAQQAAIARNMLQLSSAKLLPFSPNVFIGFSVGGFGGGSNLVAQPTGSGPFARSEPQFGSFADRTDLDVMAYWSLQNLGVGNRALTNAARSRLRSANWEEIAALEQVRKEVTVAHRRSVIRYSQLEVGEVSMAAAAEAFREDLIRIQGNEGLPIEVLDSLELVERTRLEYLRAVMEFNRAQFDLYVALGQPPADMLARPAEGKITVAPAIEEAGMEESR